MIFDQLKKKRVELMKAKDKVTLEMYKMLLSAIKNKVINDGVEETDEVVIAVIQSELKTREKSLQDYAGRDDLIAETQAEIEEYSQYLPKQLTEDEIKEIVAGMEDSSNLGAVMGYFKANYAGQVNMGLVSKIARG